MKSKDLVSKLLDEEDDPLNKARTADQASRQIARELDAEHDDGDEEDPEAFFEDELSTAIQDAIPGSRVRTFSEDGVLTTNKGLVVDTGYGTFQVTIVLKTRA